MSDERLAEIGQALLEVLFEVPTLEELQIYRSTRGELWVDVTRNCGRDRDRQTDATRHLASLLSALSVAPPQ